MRAPTKKQIGIAALVLLAPGGFILGATLAARHYKRRVTEQSGDDQPDESDGLPDRTED